jgi:hypothetical protein
MLVVGALNNDEVRICNKDSKDRTAKCNPKKLCSKLNAVMLIAQRLTRLHNASQLLQARLVSGLYLFSGIDSR